ncbi:MAG: YybH family protein [Planctomycetota bacterium]|jgi:uncharacterized protein (TIGR02246 family)
MKMVFMLSMTVCSFAAMLASESIAQTDEEAAIRKAVELYVGAFNRGDAKAVASMWSPEAVYINPRTDERVIGREAIEKQMENTFADTKGIQLEATSKSIQLISPSVAAEHGTAKLMLEKQTLETTEYTAIYVKRDGQWLLDRMTEEEVIAPPSHYEPLKGLEWMVGRWVDQDDKATVVTECRWARNNNFLVRTFEVHVRERIDMSGIQFIGWDPASKQIRSWVFDSDGGFGQGNWTKKENRWYIQQTGVLHDGRKHASVNIITYLNDDAFTLQSVNRTVDGELLPNVDEVKLTKEPLQ